MIQPDAGYVDPIWALYSGPDTPIVRGILIVMFLVWMVCLPVVLWVEGRKFVRWVRRRIKR